MQKSIKNSFRQFSSHPTFSDKIEGFKEGTWPKFLSKDRATISPQYLNHNNADQPQSEDTSKYNRWMQVLYSVPIQLVNGSFYAWSCYNQPLTQLKGVVVSSASDIALSSAIATFSMTTIALGFTTFFLGKWTERVGPRMTIFTGAGLYGLAYALSGVGAYTHTLLPIYIGYGGLVGLSVGIVYLSTVSTMMKWFPDRRGMATGMSLTFFGLGAMYAANVSNMLLGMHFIPPTFIGEIGSTAISVVDGIQYADLNGTMTECVVATANDLKNHAGLLAGVYAVGTGNTGLANTWWMLGAMGGSAMAAGSLLFKQPFEGFVPKGFDPASLQINSAISSKGNVNAVTALRTPQFWLLWLSIIGNCCAGHAILSCAKTMMSEIFSSKFPMIVTAGFTLKYVSSLSVCNSAGRAFWAFISDYIGRKNTYLAFGLGVPILAYIPTAIMMDSVSSLYIFTAGTCVILSMYAGTLSVLPAYIADMFGQKHTASIHGRALTGWTVAGLLGPQMNAYFRSSQKNVYINELANKIDPQVFNETFKSPVTELSSLVSNNTVTINRLMEIAPVGTIDPSMFLYNYTMYGAAGMLSMAFLMNLLQRPVDPKFYEENEVTPELNREAIYENAKVALDSAEEERIIESTKSKIEIESEENKRL